jgi:hypothetical protein
MTLDKLSNDKSLSPVKRNFSKLEKETTRHDTRVQETRDETEMTKYEEDKKFLEKTFLKKNIWKNPNSLMETLEKFYLGADLKNQQRLDLVGLNHWFFKSKTERALIQETLLMLNGIESETYGRDQTGKFEPKIPIQVDHISPQTLASVMNTFITLTNIALEVGEHLRVLSENFNTNVVESFIECVKEFVFEYKGYLEDVQCIFLKQAAQGIILSIIFSV